VLWNFFYVSHIMLFDTITLIFTSFVSYGRILCCAELHNNLLSYCIFWCCAYQILNEECTYLLIPVVKWITLFTPHWLLMSVSQWKVKLTGFHMLWFESIDLTEFIKCYIGLIINQNYLQPETNHRSRFRDTDIEVPSDWVRFSLMLCYMNCTWQ